MPEALLYHALRNGREGRATCSGLDLNSELITIPGANVGSEASNTRPDFDDVSGPRRANMRAIRATNTKPEVTVRRLLHSMGYRFRLHRRDLPGKPDIVFSGRMKVIEVRGCFWHRHSEPGCRNAVLPRSRADWWRTKLDSNVARDARNLSLLEGLGWSVLVLWECQLVLPGLPERLRVFLDH